MAIPRETAEVVLPGGLLDGAGRTHRRSLVRPLTGFEEELIGASRASPRAAVATRVLARCVLRVGRLRASRSLVRRLSSGDRGYLLLQILRLTAGTVVRTVVRCPRPACGRKMDVDFDLDRLPVERRDPAQQHSVRIRDGARQADGAAGARETEVVFRLPCGADEEVIARWADEDEQRCLDRILARCIERIGEAGAPSIERIRALEAGSREAITSAILERMPGIRVQLALSCPECGHDFELPLDPAQLLFDEALQSAGRLEWEVHALATTYHWPLGEILGLTRTRRQLHLRLAAHPPRAAVASR
jgi:hypothetical protein